MFAILLVGIAFGEEETLDGGLFRTKGYGIIYNPSCRNGSQLRPGCFRLGWQKCRYPGNIPAEQVVL
ncbi:unnamed protein product [Allacma fusca]|uniref:Uncharacterized protein n=1 Tax=Allacma fusca TaxID=39272 RepID=A0A8J2KF75_9HEXA|nr:unnamed protein product [Allacma fusca]